MDVPGAPDGGGPTLGVAKAPGFPIGPPGLPAFGTGLEPIGLGPAPLAPIGLPAVGSSGANPCPGAAAVKMVHGSSLSSIISRHTVMPHTPYTRYHLN
jgi:hypothetical protein